MVARLRDFGKENSSWLFLACGFFVAGYLVAVTALRNNPLAFRLIMEQLERLMELGDSIYSSHPLRGIYLVLMNNTVATFSIILFSFILGLPPLFSLFGNGTLMGVVSILMRDQGISFPAFFFLGILPHGILELPAFFISASLGLKIGYHVVFPLPGESRLNSLKILWQEVKRMAPVIFLLLAAAACIEVLVTPLLLKAVLPGAGPL
jgi:stage II sporulation protein M